MAVTINKGTNPGINLTPMIDCVFLLLIFFLVATEFEREQRELTLDIVLPQASEAMPLTAKPQELFVNIGRNGQFSINGDALDEQGVLRVLQQAAADNPGRQTVIIRADEHCEWKFVVAVMNLCNAARIRDYRVTVLEPRRT